MSYSSKLSKSYFLLCSLIHTNISFKVNFQLKDISITKLIHKILLR